MDRCRYTPTRERDGTRWATRTVGVVVVRGTSSANDVPPGCGCVRSTGNALQWAVGRGAGHISDYRMWAECYTQGDSRRKRVRRNNSLPNAGELFSDSCKIIIAIAGNIFIVTIALWRKNPNKELEQ